MLNKYCTFIVFIFISIANLNVAKAKSADSTQNKTSISLHSFMDVFYAYDFNKPKFEQRQDFFYNHNRHNEFNLNLGMIGLKIDNAQYRAKLTFQTGTYSYDNYATEPVYTNSIYESTVGISLNKQNNLWIDAGIFPSHIGFESAISINNPTLTRSLTAENSPYYLAGTKLSYKPNDKWTAQLVICNGWQRIQRIRGKELPSIGTRLAFDNDKFQLNWSTLIGNENPYPNSGIRIFNDLYSTINLGSKAILTLGFDYGLEENTANNNQSEFNSWWNTTAIIQYLWNYKWSSSIRAEYFSDQYLIVTNSNLPFNTSSASFNIDYKPQKSMALRLEARYFTADEKVFEGWGNPIKSDFLLCASMALNIEQILLKK